jgi:hypothetical protein
MMASCNMTVTKSPFSSPDLALLNPPRLAKHFIITFGYDRMAYKYLR